MNMDLNRLKQLAGILTEQKLDFSGSAELKKYENPEDVKEVFETLDKSIVFIKRILLSKALADFMKTKPANDEYYIKAKSAVKELDDYIAYLWNEIKDEK